jgi:hypothetical protein
MGTCICGNEVKDEPYREPSPMPKEVKMLTPEEVKATLALDDSKPSNSFPLFGLSALSFVIGMDVWGVGYALPARAAIHLGIGVMTVALATPLLYGILVVIPQLAARSGDGCGHPKGSEDEWINGFGTILAMICGLGLIGVAIFGSVWLLLTIGQWISSLI